MFEKLCMKKKNLNLSDKEQICAGILFASGIAIGASVTALIYENQKRVDGDEILETVKKMFLVDGPIEGSWIELHPVPLTRFSSETEVYYGGISRKEKENDDLVQYEFIADSYTGTILDIYKL
ncbi:PepSY domain-containing protein [Jeotgalibaca sp. MA1X17-3]|uniref:PepSY domain-containing protein n=1 Tax=Jeotgalibaca sp. MA1X17-3 TaxID=2908211 RepID=UPI001F43903C|nr:PepSY domain-containing protein [Jeotgalibaca sp. MA1X17-3]UJF15184.1 PepSY domain-containing protein [Jeotgalibaca sp. MA1X17-3]